MTPKKKSNESMRLDQPTTMTPKRHAERNPGESPPEKYRKDVQGKTPLKRISKTDNGPEKDTQKENLVETILSVKSKKEDTFHLNETTENAHPNTVSNSAATFEKPAKDDVTKQDSSSDEVASIKTTTPTKEKNTSPPMPDPCLNKPTAPEEVNSIPDQQTTKEVLTREDMVSNDTTTQEITKEPAESGSEEEKISTVSDHLTVAKVLKLRGKQCVPVGSYNEALNRAVVKAIEETNRRKAGKDIKSSMSPKKGFTKYSKEANNKAKIRGFQLKIDDYQNMMIQQDKEKKKEKEKEKEKEIGKIKENKEGKEKENTENTEGKDMTTETEKSPQLPQKESTTVEESPNNPCEEENKDEGKEEENEKKEESESRNTQEENEEEEKSEGEENMIEKAVESLTLAPNEKPLNDPNQGKEMALMEMENGKEKEKEKENEKEGEPIVIEEEKTSPKKRNKEEEKKEVPMELEKEERQKKDNEKERKKRKKKENPVKKASSPNNTKTKRRRSSSQPSDNSSPKIKKNQLSEIMDEETTSCRYPRTNLTLQSRIPKDLETAAFKVLDRICNNIVNCTAGSKNSEDTYKYNIALLFHFFPIFLTSNTIKSQKEEIKKKLEDFSFRNELPKINDIVPPKTSNQSPAKKKKKITTVAQTNQEETFHTNLDEGQRKKMIRFCKAGRYRKAIKCLTQGETADPTEEKAFNLLNNLHPQDECDYGKFVEEFKNIADGMPTPTDKDRNAIMLSILNELVARLKDDKAVGPTNWNNSAIKQCFKRCKYFAKALCEIAINMEKGIFPFPDLLTDSFLIGLWKDKEHKGVRPIAIANNLSKLLVTAAWKFCMQYRGIGKLPIQDNQFGISVSCGAELPAFITREYYRKKTLFQTISLDITNAFNSVNREAMLNKVKNSIPALAPLVGLLYLHDSRLTLSSGAVIYSKQGVRQGCPSVHCCSHL